MNKKSIFILCGLALAIPQTAFAAPSADTGSASPSRLWIVGGDAKKEVARFSSAAALSDGAPQFRDAAAVANGKPNGEPEAIAVAAKELDRHGALEDRVKDWYEQGKPVYLFSDKLNVADIERSLGLTLRPEDDGEKKETKGQPEDDWQLFGIRKGNGAPDRVFFGKVTMADAKTGDAAKPASDALIDAVVRADADWNAPERPPIASMRPRDDIDPPPCCEDPDPIPLPADANVLNGTDTNYLYAPLAGGGSIHIATLRSDWSLYRNYSYDSAPNYDLFYVKDQVRLDTFNGAAGTKLETYHQLPYHQKDDIVGWAPYNSSIGTTSGEWRHFPVRLPWNVSWTSSNYGPISFYSEKMQFTPESIYWNASQFGSSVTFVPGTAWNSYYTYVNVDLTHAGSVRLNGTDYYFTIRRNVVYDY
ncbi:hypothetical protein [Paenibacillus flagellatus]|uniref:Uncharacterized protein n=1 Tax=Paenibacillus flagellatus TaxID=2211139 RepID=A0A2V5KE60_9BACL|nr:hypothetical protein [Paenibacillus flagellatus]PYI56604.1 hypothetical protein DLM86_06455 [Paenibacillus flagellatus]